MAEDQKLYRQNVLDGFPNGCLLDLRVRFAYEFIKAGEIGSEVAPDRIAVYALDVATELLAEADRRGLIEPLPDDDNINAQVKKQAGRIGKFSFEQQAAGQRAAQEAGGVVASPFGPRSN